jgi:PhnB protein
MVAINPHLNFNGDTKEAFDFYKSIFGGEFTAVMCYGEMPGCDGMPVTEADKEKIMHIALPIGDGNILMAADTIESMGQVTAGNNFSISVSTENREEADKLFGGLSGGGEVEMPLADAFWGDYFGMLTDKFGIQWMVNCNSNSK